MHGSFRIRKKHLKQAGWQVLADRRAGDSEYELVLEKPDRDRATVKASSRARAYRKAEQELLVKSSA
ncbi:MAG: hypothetical protein ACLFVT_05760 [Syntrophobacteria bacterium]